MSQASAGWRRSRDQSLVASGGFLRSWHLLSIYRIEFATETAFGLESSAILQREIPGSKRDLYEIISQQQRDDY